MGGGGAPDGAEGAVGDGRLRGEGGGEGAEFAGEISGGGGGGEEGADGVGGGDDEARRGGGGGHGCSGFCYFSKWTTNTEEDVWA